MTRQQHRDTPVGSLMKAPVATVAGRATVRMAAKALHGARVGTLVVMHGHDLGAILSERDIVRALAQGVDPDKAYVADIMSTDPRYVTTGQRAEEALQMMLNAEIRHLPVVDEGELVGIVSIRDLSRTLVSG